VSLCALFVFFWLRQRAAAAAGGEEAPHRWRSLSPLRAESGISARAIPTPRAGPYLFVRPPGAIGSALPALHPPHLLAGRGKAADSGTALCRAGAVVIPVRQRALRGIEAEEHFR